MKKFLIFCGLLIAASAFAQYTPLEIKKNRISKIKELSVTAGNREPARHETLYDANGNDTAEFLGPAMYRRTKYEYNEKGQIIKRNRYDGSGKEMETAVYNYKPDGSYTISNTDKDFGMTDLTYYDRWGKITKTKSPDGTERMYTYDAKGRLLTIKSKSDNGGVITHLQYNYNPRGQLIKEISKGDYKWAKTYTYNAKGLITKSKNNSVTDGVVDPEVTVSYEYEFR
jgi:YD repeat-containing protein